MNVDVVGERWPIDCKRQPTTITAEEEPGDCPSPLIHGGAMFSALPTDGSKSGATLIIYDIDNRLPIGRNFNELDTQRLSISCLESCLFSFEVVQVQIGIPAIAFSGAMGKRTGVAFPDHLAVTRSAIVTPLQHDDVLPR